VFFVLVNDQRELTPVFERSEKTEIGPQGHYLALTALTAKTVNEKANTK
jgi:hypothetical protein